jgi:hypothetical protein
MLGPKNCVSILKKPFTMHIIRGYVQVYPVRNVPRRQGDIYSLGMGEEAGVYGWIPPTLDRISLNYYGWSYKFSSFVYSQFDERGTL